MPKERKTFAKPETDASENYAMIIKALGGGKFTIRLNGTTTEVIGSLRGKLKHKKFKKSNKAEQGKIVSVSFRDFEEKTVDILNVLDDDEVRVLKRLKKLSFPDESIKTDVVVDNNVSFEFEEL